jgi:hypothetical protein
MIVFLALEAHLSWYSKNGLFMIFYESRLPKSQFSNFFNKIFLQFDRTGPALHF